MRTVLPAPRLTGKRVRAVRREMLERGLALAVTPWFFADGEFPGLTGRRTILPPGNKLWWQFSPFARYGRWLEELLATVLPEESPRLTSLEFRHEPAGAVDRQVDRLHADGSYIRSVYTRYGPATIYRDGKAERPVPRGQTLLMTAMQRARAVRIPCTLHRRPGAGPERAVIVCSFEPCPEAPNLANAYRLAAGA